MPPPCALPCLSRARAGATASDAAAHDQRDDQPLTQAAPSYMRGVDSTAMEMRRHLAALASAALLAQAACASTSYTPRPDGRIATTLEDGRPMLIKDGKSYPAGGAGLAEVVAGNPAAEEHARSYATGHALRHRRAADRPRGADRAAPIVAAPGQDTAGMNLPVSSERQVAGTVLVVAGLPRSSSPASTSRPRRRTSRTPSTSTTTAFPRASRRRHPPGGPTSPVPLTPQAPPPAPTHAAGAAAQAPRRPPARTDSARAAN